MRPGTKGAVMLTFGQTFFGEAYFGENVEENVEESVDISPSRVTDFAISIENGNGQMTFNKSDNIMNNAYLSLSVPLGSFFQNPDFGFDCSERLKNTAKNAADVEERIKKALQWLIDIGRASEINVYSERDMQQDLNRLKFLVEIIQTDGGQISFETFLEVV